MPTTGYTNPQEADPRRWERCRAAASAAMLSAGWSPKAKKFSEVQHRRALKLWGRS